MLHASSKAEISAARKIIADLLNACRAQTLVAESDNDVFSIDLPGTRMGLNESNKRMEDAVRAAWLFMTGKALGADQDPVAFIIHSGKETLG